MRLACLSIRTCACTVLLLASAAVYAGSYRYSRPVQASENYSPLWAVNLDEAIYWGSLSSLNDLRVVDENDQEIPYLLRTVRTKQIRLVRQISQSHTPDLQTNGQNGIVIMVSLDEQAQVAEGFSLLTDQHDFEYDITVAGSDDGKNWTPLLDHARIYDYSRYMAVSQREVALPVNSFRQFKISVNNAVQSHVGQMLQLTRTLQNGQEQQRTESQQITQQNLHIQRIEFWHHIQQNTAGVEQLSEYSINDFQITQDTEQKNTIIDVNTARQPLNAFKLDIATANYNRAFELKIAYQQGKQQAYRTVAQGRIEAIHVADINRDPQPISFNTHSAERYRLVLHNQDSPPLAISRITGLGPTQQIVFLPQAEHQYQVRYGQEQDSAPQYDVAAIQELLVRNSALQSVLLGEEQLNQGAIDQQASRVDYALWLNNERILTLAAGLMVAGLLWSLVKLGKRL